ncbi:MAG: 4-hydroxy-tetrahydrodipicolinate synthase [Candidatus Solincola sediminis]|uniref:4-hydroxy-tetrahydrodipicolinate synthase n=1 Tax=Candidatus Solincola sediminis TaxID=1797199 RepID=A0A1F2WUD0_9ACTN|nr:MAG: 4-hydroxy-tetrahydrodipicolinate synthase [Candidatus Solincola sediminis]OFW60499.1 MAG: 4-hydroxy-tetrahydrodipicolinate synthase [Candidatus Solincola sediminis]
MVDWNVRGCLIPLVTPFDARGGVDEPALRKLVNYLIDEQAAAGLVPCGTTGESPTLTTEEHLHVIEIVQEETRGRVPVVAGTGSNSTQEAIEMTAAAEKSGVAASLQVSPYYNRPTQEGIYAHFKAVANSTSLPIILYNIPIRTGRNIEVDTVLRLSEIDNIVGIKEASGSIMQASAILERTRGGDEFCVYSGEDPITFLILCLGGHGCIAAVGHVIGVEFSQMCGMVWEGRFDEARELHFRIMPVIEALFCEPNPTAIKQALNWMGIPVGGLRLPLMELSGARKDELRRALIGLGKLPASGTATITSM